MALPGAQASAGGAPAREQEEKEEEEEEAGCAFVAGTQLAHRRLARLLARSCLDPWLACARVCQSVGVRAGGRVGACCVCCVCCVCCCRATAWVESE